MPNSIKNSFKMKKRLNSDVPIIDKHKTPVKRNQEEVDLKHLARNKNSVHVTPKRQTPKQHTPKQLRVNRKLEASPLIKNATNESPNEISWNCQSPPYSSCRRVKHPEQKNIKAIMKVLTTEQDENKITAEENPLLELWECAEVSKPKISTSKETPKEKKFTRQQRYKFLQLMEKINDNERVSKISSDTISKESPSTSKGMNNEANIDWEDDDLFCDDDFILQTQILEKAFSAKQDKDNHLDISSCQNQMISKDASEACNSHSVKLIDLTVEQSEERSKLSQSNEYQKIQLFSKETFVGDEFKNTSRKVCDKNKNEPILMTSLSQHSVNSKFISSEIQTQNSETFVLCPNTQLSPEFSDATQNVDSNLMVIGTQCPQDVFSDDEDDLFILNEVLDTSFKPNTENIIEDKTSSELPLIDLTEDNLDIIQNNVEDDDDDDDFVPPEVLGYFDYVDALYSSQSNSQSKTESVCSSEEIARKRETALQKRKLLPKR